ncbi:High affinity cAMP-specific and IBMX-insensitive 3',5'-cyclic phosphodiesterase 9A [Mortierella claussenii]|nr:High affinity cAMP-specific and IBMX-insensitive 3',5'-cyclic phosphodiesterase 9A [Mortierella claussenii]
MLILRHCHLSSEDLITCERALLRFVSGRAKTVDLEFNVWDYTVPEIYGYILGMFVKLDLVECLGISSGELLDFIVDVDRGYLATFYHSFYHAADVTAVLYHMLLGMHASQYLSKPDMAALLLAGLCHDIGHPGLNNLFQVNAKTELVKQHGEASVLEKYSCSLAMDLVTKHTLFRNISKSPCSILPEGQPATEASMRNAMVKAILATDMTFHYDMLNNLNNLFEATTSPVSSSASEADTESEPESDGHKADPVCHKLTPSTTKVEETTVAKETDTTVTATVTETEVTVASVNVPKQKSVSMASPISSSSGPSCSSSRSTTLPEQRRRRRSSCDSNSSQSSGESDSALSPISIDHHLYSPADLTPEQRQNLCNCLLHAADISNALKPWTICKRWSDLVVQEFFRQGDIEKAQDLPVSPNMDRNQHNQPQISLGFGDFVVQPYFEAFVELLPDAAPVLTSLANNRAQWVALQKSAQQFGNDPYLSVDPLEDPTLLRRPSSPDLSHLPSGRRVSVAAGVLVLDDTRSLRTPHRRLRHSTNTEATTSGGGHGLRRMKRSLSGRSLSTSMQNLHAHSSSTRSSQSSGKTSQGQEILISALKRQASLTERDMTLASQNLALHMYKSHQAKDTEASTVTQWPSPPLKPISSAAVSSITTYPHPQGSSKNKGGNNGSSNYYSNNILDSAATAEPIAKPATTSSTAGNTFRQKRLASLQSGSRVPATIRSDYSDGYTVLKDDRPSQLSESGHIPSSSPDGLSHPHHPHHPSTLPTTSSSPSKGHAKSYQSSAPPMVSTHAGNRSSTPAVMMSKIKYDWALSPTLPEVPALSRFGCGPLDGDATPAAVEAAETAETAEEEKEGNHQGVRSVVLDGTATDLPDASVTLSHANHDHHNKALRGEESTSSPSKSTQSTVDGTVLISTADGSADKP